MGKTSLAQAAVHQPEVALKYEERRYFVACDAGEAHTSLITLIATAIGVTSGNEQAKQRIVLRKLTDSETLLALDNFESVWEDPQIRSSTEAFLTALCGLHNLSVVITLRGSERPMGVTWTSPILEPLEPLCDTDALQTFLAISDAAQDDENLHVLLAKLDNVPLAVVLMANMAQYESCLSLLRRWEDSRTSMLVRGTQDRLSSLNVSIGYDLRLWMCQVNSHSLSLLSPRLKSMPHCVVLLGLLSILPDAVDEADIPLLVPQHIPIRRGISALLQTALIYRPTPTQVRVLAPIREHMIRNCPPPSLSLGSLGLFCNYKAHYLNELHEQASENANNLIAKACGNIDAVAYYALKMKVDIGSVIMSLKTMQSGCRVQTIPVSLVDLGLKLARESGDKMLIASSLWCLGRSYGSEAKIPYLECHDEAATLFLALKEHQLYVQTLISRAQYASLRFSDRTYTDQAISAARTHGFPLLEAQGLLIRVEQYTHFRTAGITTRRRDLHSAMNLLLNTDTAWAKSIRNEIRRNLGNLLFDEGHFDSANALWSSLLRAPMLAANIAARSAMIAFMRSDFSVAISRRRLSLALWRKMGFWNDVFNDLLDLATLYVGKSDYRKANRSLAECDDILIRHYWEPQHAQIQAIRGSISLAQLDYANAETCLLQAHRVLRIGDMPSPGLKCGFLLAKLALSRGHYLEAQTLLILNALGRRKCEQKPDLCFALNELAELYFCIADIESARAMTLAIFPKLEDMGTKRQVADCIFRMARIDYQCGDGHQLGSKVAEAINLYVVSENRPGICACIRFLQSL